MPVTIQLTGLKYKNSQGQFQSADCLKGEDADISIIAPDYSELIFPVSAGELCTHDLKLYRAKQDIPTSENWTESHWDERTIEEELAAKYTKPAGGIPATDLADGVIPDIIDDEAGAGDTDVTFSADKLTTDLFSLSNALNQSNAATNSDIGKAHSPKTVENGQVTEWKYIDVAKEDSLEELAENGSYIKGQTQEFYELTSGKSNNNATIPVSETISVDSKTGYIIIPKDQIPEGLYYDNTKYRVNTVFIKNDYQISGTYKAWQTTSPIQYVAPADYDSILINVNKLSGTYASGELNEALYKVNTLYVGQLATKEYVNEKVKRGNKQIYPDGFTSRIMPDIYYNGRFDADIDTNNYKIEGTGEVWVATDGNDTTGDGSESNPFATITKALNQSASTIKLKSGTYEQGVHYSSSADFKNRNWIGIGNVVFQSDSSGHYSKAIGSAYFENIIFKHGNPDTNPAFAAKNNASGNIICFVNCTFRDGGTNGLSLTGIDAILKGCVAFGNKLDGFNYHDSTIDNVVYVPNVLEIDCVAYNNGSSESGSDSCNGSTAHDGSKIIRLNGEYCSCYGGVIAEIARSGEEPTISVNYGVLAHDSTGTGSYKASFWASVNTKMYLYDCQSYGGTYDISAINDALVVSRRLTTGRDVPAVNADNTATVLQY